MLKEEMYLFEKAYYALYELTNYYFVSYAFSSSTNIWHD